MPANELNRFQASFRGSPGGVGVDIGFSRCLSPSVTHGVSSASRTQLCIPAGPIIVTQLKFRSESACRGYRAVPAVLHICLRTMGMVAFAVPKVITLTLE